MATGSRETVLVNRNPYHGVQGLFIPQYVQDQYGVKSLAALSTHEVAKLFDSDGNFTRGRPNGFTRRTTW